MLRPYLKNWDWDSIFGHTVKAISSLGVHSPCIAHCYHRIDLPVKKGPLLIYGCVVYLLYLFNMLFEYVPKFISVH